MAKSVAGHISWDLDGCLWDSDKAHYLAVNEALKPYGEWISEEEHLSTFKGLPTLQKCLMLTQMGRLSESAHQDVAKRKQVATLAAIEQTVTPRAEVSAVLAELRASGWKQCCCSNSIRQTVQRVLLGMGIMDFFDFYLSNQDVKRAKPAPEMFLKAAQLYHISPLRLVVIEDANAGKRAAMNAGCKLVPINGPEDVTPNLLHRILAEGESIARLESSRILRCSCVAGVA